MIVKKNKKKMATQSKRQYIPYVPPPPTPAAGVMAGATGAEAEAPLPLLQSQPRRQNRRSKPLPLIHKIEMYAVKYNFVFVCSVLAFSLLAVCLTVRSTVQCEVFQIAVFKTITSSALQGYGLQALLIEDRERTYMNTTVLLYFPHNQTKLEATRNEWKKRTMKQCAYYYLTGNFYWVGAESKEVIYSMFIIVVSVFVLCMEAITLVRNRFRKEVPYVLMENGV